MVLGHHGPLIGQGFHVAFACVEHRLDGENHARLQFHALAREAVMQYLRLIVVHLADAMAAVFAHHAVACFLGQGLNGMPDIAQGRSGADDANTGAHGVVSGFHQAPRFRARLTHEVHAAGVAVPAVLDHGDVDIDDVAVFQRGGCRDAMAHDVVHRGADCFREAVITHVAGDSLLHIDDVVVAELVQLVCGHAGFNVFRDHGQDFGGQHAGQFGLSDLRRAVDDDVVSH